MQSDSGRERLYQFLAMQRRGANVGARSTPSDAALFGATPTDFGAIGGATYADGTMDFGATPAMTMDFGGTPVPSTSLAELEGGYDFEGHAGVDMGSMGGMDFAGDPGVDMGSFSLAEGAPMRRDPGATLARPDVFGAAPMDFAGQGGANFGSFGLEPAPRRRQPVVSTATGPIASLYRTPRSR